jgi:hypothetical protein
MDCEVVDSMGVGKVSRGEANDGEGMCARTCSDARALRKRLSCGFCFIF